MIEHLILLKKQNIMDINVGLLQCFTVSLIKSLLLHVQINLLLLVFQVVLLKAKLFTLIISRSLIKAEN